VVLNNVHVDLAEGAIFQVYRSCHNGSDMAQGESIYGTIRGVMSAGLCVGRGTVRVRG